MMESFQTDMIQIQDTIETMVPEEKLRGRSMTVLAIAVTAEKLNAMVFKKPFDLDKAIRKVLNLEGKDGEIDKK